MTITRQPNFPHLPYRDTSGWSGSEASEERALDHDADGTTSQRQRLVAGLVYNTQDNGATWREVAAHTHLHHGQVTSALSVLHKEGVLARLKHERRGRCSVYIHHDFVNEREIAPHGRQRPVEVREAMSRLRQDQAEDDNVSVVWTDALETVLDYLERR